ncbi:ABC transporter ATP-binding protein [Pseudoxanthobacter sp.]|uniref:ABC transporter ATP-binding protein n=1 Tax=Pseudoxanthobacter sp. TaxID=1925742 RepID=UPI002FE1EE78
MVSLRLEAVTVSFPGLAAPVLDVPRLDIAAGEAVAITGPSGSGKSTLVNVITGLEKPASGRVMWGRHDLAAMGEAARDRFRAETVGLVMQDFHLFAGLSALENVLLPARLRAFRLPAEAGGRALALLARVGIARPEQPVETLSRGEMQRVAVARALLRRPKVIVADEPTASLDAAAGGVVAGLMADLAAEEGAMLIAVTHDDRLVRRMARIIRLEAGRIVADARAEAAA